MKALGFWGVFAIGMLMGIAVADAPRHAPEGAFTTGYIAIWAGGLLAYTFLLGGVVIWSRREDRMSRTTLYLGCAEVGRG